MKRMLFFTSTVTPIIRAFSTFGPVSIHPKLMDQCTTNATRLFASGNDCDKEKYTKSYKIHGTGTGSAVEMKTNTNHVLHTDVPQKMGGNDTAPQPVEHLLAALIGCTQATAVYVGRMMKPRLLIDRIEFDLVGYRDERGALELPIEEIPLIPARLERVSGIVKIHFKEGINPTDQQLKMLKEQTEARCPVASMIHMSGCNMDTKWISAD